jgi:nicotinate-nucleotide--dimethylbenzimidazole phosphoribosyltransferase
MNGAATDGLAPPPEDVAPGSTPENAFEHAAQNIPDVDEAARAAAGKLVGPDAGRLADLAGWLAATQGRTPPAGPRRPRCVVMGEATSLVHSLADSLQVGVHELPIPDSPSDALRAGISAADDEVDGGADLIVLVAEAAKTDPAPAALVSVLRGVEPVALLPRGSAAVDSGAWSQHAARIRDLRRAALRFRARPDQLLIELGSPPLAATAGFLLRATARRTPIVLGGTLTAVAALLVSA